ncbi:MULTISPECIES: tyrosinase cofactor [unclassified Streptomyces]|uniref:apotyrosinase chaperone MelC1 n=1 Tax=unclassified Streptomyces TaxID=2593676 RepID=UPI00093A23D4|nr:tyrosinase cofactor [Streptomyces sp. TSRI0281]OKI43442.1 tyrosinase [Streptomyces sp. TSRI0281]
MSKLTRRQTLGAVTGAAAGIALVGVATASADTAPVKGNDKAAAPGGTGGPASFDEVFQGRRIQGLATEAHAHAGHSTGYRVLVDGRELHVMQHGKSGWSSAINHYERFANPRDAARTAVTSLKGADVVPFDPTA